MPKKSLLLILGLITIGLVVLIVHLNANWTGVYYHNVEYKQMVCETKKFTTEEGCESWRQEIIKKNGSDDINANETLFCGYKCTYQDGDEACFPSSCEGNSIEQ